jgi:nucleoside-diphosphate-sugar epimerase
MKILLTGATGFIGKALVGELILKNFDISIAVRQKTHLFSDKVKQFIVGDFATNPNFLDSLSEVDCLVHLAGRAHLVDNTEAFDSSEYKKINTELTLSLAKQAMVSGTKRFIFLSSIGVNGNQTDKPFVESDMPNPQDPYSLSKYEAEVGLIKLAKNSDLEVVIIRPPLVYGNGAPGNFSRLVRWGSAKFLLPLPFGAVHNARSFIAIENLVSFIITCISHTKAANEVFLISDEKSISTTHLLKNIAKAFNKKVFLIPVPSSLIFFLARILGREKDAARLLSSLIIDSSKARKLLGWEQVVTMNEQLNKIKQNETSL